MAVRSWLRGLAEAEILESFVGDRNEFHFDINHRELARRVGRSARRVGVWFSFSPRHRQQQRASQQHKSESPESESGGFWNRPFEQTFDALRQRAPGLDDADEAQ